MADRDSPDAGAPRHLVLSTPGRNYNTPDAAAAVALLAEADFQSSALQQVAEYVRQNGTLDKLTIVGHGGPLSVVSSQQNRPSVELKIPDILVALYELQRKTGIKIADKIVFNACSTMTDLSPSSVGFLRTMAKAFDADIEGFTTVGITSGPRERRGELDNPMAGLSAVFGRDGSVRRGQTMDMHDRNVLLSNEFGKGEWLHGNRTMLRVLTMSDAAIEAQSGGGWFACHDGKAQAEGAACQMKALKPKAP